MGSNRLATYLSFIRFSHSVFALPFALTGALLAWRSAPFEWRQILWVIVAMVSARSAAMGFNRLVDARMDALNPRTAMREIPRGALSRRDATIFVVDRRRSSSCVAAFQLNRICGLLSPVALAIVFWYSLAKRYTSYTQAFLGLAMAVAPVGGWLAAGGRSARRSRGCSAWRSGCGWAASTFSMPARTSSSIARTGLNSIPVRFGVARSLVDLARDARRDRRLHGGARRGWCRSGRSISPAWRWWPALLIYEQSLVSEHDLSQVKRAFDLNGWVGILYFVTTGIALYVR